jgi:HEAT repeats/PBS lyase HEAT-like repeat
MSRRGGEETWEPAPPSGPSPELPVTEDKSDLKVVLQFFIVPLSLVIVLVSVFFGLQMLRSRRPDGPSTLRSLRSGEGFLERYVGDVKRWQSGYDLSLLLRGDRAGLVRLVPDLIVAFRESGEKGDLKLRRYLALALGQAADPRALDALREGMRDADAQTRLFAAWGTMRIDEPGALPALREAASDSDPGVRTMAIFALGQNGDRAAAGTLRGALLDDDEDVRWNAALALARLGDPAATPVLIQMLKDSLGRGTAERAGATLRKDLAINAMRGLALLRSAEGRGMLETIAASGGDPEIREAARLALESYRAGAESSSP